MLDYVLNDCLVSSSGNPGRPAVARITGHYTELVWKESLFSDPVGYNGSEIGRFLFSANIADTTVSAWFQGRIRVRFIERFAGLSLFLWTIGTLLWKNERVF